MSNLAANIVLSGTYVVGLREGNYITNFGIVSGADVLAILEKSDAPAKISAVRVG